MRQCTSLLIYRFIFIYFYDRSRYNHIREENKYNQNHPLNGWFARPLEGVITGLPPAAGGIECLTTHYFFKQPLSCGCLFLLNYSCYP